MHKLKIGLIVDGPPTSHFVEDLLNWAAQRDDVEITHLIRLRGKASAQPSWLDSIGPTLLRFVLRLEGGFRKHRSKLNSAQSGQITLGHTGRLREELARLEAEKFDLLLYLGRYSQPLKLFDAVRLGLVSVRYCENSFEHDDLGPFQDVRHGVP